jgi:uncharacterized protein YjbI with pentapeptide repeats
VLCGAVLCDAVLCGAVLCDAVLCDAVLCGAVLCGAVLYGAVLCGAVLCGLCCAILIVLIEGKFPFCRLLNTCARESYRNALLENWITRDTFDVSNLLLLGFVIFF